MTTAPWWATGVFTIAGVVIAQLVAAILSRRQNRFEDSRRWHEERKDIYLEVNKYTWRLQDAIFNHFDRDTDLPEDFEQYENALSEVQLKIRLIASEQVNSAVEDLFLSASMGITSALQEEAGRALDACDSMRHQLYYVVDLMRAELTSNRSAITRWTKEPLTRWGRRRRAQEVEAKIKAMSIGSETWERGPDGEYVQTIATGVAAAKKSHDSGTRTDDP